MFRRLFGGQSSVRPEGYAEGWKLFELGMAYASRYECAKALEYYGRSIAVCKNPAPYINRANILCKRIRYQEALGDLLEARKLDQAQSNEFHAALRREIGMAETVTYLYRNGIREKLIDDLKENGEDYVVGKIFCASFGFDHQTWEWRFVLPPYAAFHFFNELDNVRKFDRLDLYPEVSEYLELYPAEFIDKKLAECPDEEAYRKAELTLHSFLCVYDEQTIIRLRQVMIYELHERLLSDDYPDVLGSLSDPRPDVTRDAYRYIHGTDFSGNEDTEEADGNWIGGLLFEGDINSDETIANIVTKLSTKVLELAPTELDVYRYLVEEAERFSKGGEVEANILKASGIAPLEYDGEISKAQKYAGNRAALDYLNDEVSPDLENLMEQEKAADVRALIFANIVLREENLIGMLKLRQKYATHYCNNCSANGHWTYYDKWSEIIDGIEARIDQVAYGHPG